MNKPVILIVNADRNEMEMLAEELQEEGFDIVGVVTSDELDHALRGKKKYALSVVDISGFDESIWQHCERMHELKIPFIMIAPQRSPTMQRDSMKHGACGLLVKPIAIKEIVEYVHTALGD